MVKNKKAMSQIVTTLIIILLTIVAIGIIWGVLKNTILKSTEEISLNDFNADLKIKKVVINDTGVKVVVHRNAGGGEITGLKFIVSNGDDSQSFEKQGVIETLATKSYFLNGYNLGIVKTVEVAPIFTTESGKQKTGDVADEYISSGEEIVVPGEIPTPPIGCTPTQTCKTENYECNSFVDDLCGRTINCGPCSGTDICGQDNLCHSDNCLVDSNACTNQSAECGIVYDDCGTKYTCGNCTELHNESWVCNDGTCVYAPECTDNCSTFNFECGVHEICGKDVNCESEVGCEAGYECVAGNDSCQQITYVNSGSVMWSGPPNVNKLFSGDALLNETAYAWKFVVFPDLASPYCYVITDTKEGDEMYPYVILTILTDPEPLTTLDIIGEDYQIWENFDDCNASIHS